MDEQLSSQVQGCLVTAQREAGARLGPALTLGPVVGSVHFTQEPALPWSWSSSLSTAFPAVGGEEAWPKLKTIYP